MRRLAGCLLLVGACSATRLAADEQVVVTIEGGASTFSPDSKWLAGVARNKTLTIWDAARGTVATTLKEHPTGIWNVAFRPDGRQLACNHSRAIRVWDVDTGKQIRSVPTRGGSLARQSSLRTVLDIATSRVVRTLIGHTDWVQDVAFSPGGKRLASGSIDRTVKLWDLATGKEILTLSGHDWYVSSIAFGPAGKWLISGSDDRTAKVWNLETGKEVFTLRGHTDWVRDVAFSPDGKWLVTGSGDSTSKVWDATTGGGPNAQRSHTRCPPCSLIDGAVGDAASRSTKKRSPLPKTKTPSTRRR